MARLLIAKGVDVNAKIVNPNNTSEFHTALGFAAACGNADIVRLLISEGADVNARDGFGFYPLFYAKGDITEIAEIFIAAGADINAVLRNAAKHGNTDMVRLLIAKGADVNAKSYEGYPLWYPVGNGFMDIVEMLIAAGADVSVNPPPLAAAVVVPNASIEMVELLITNGADVNRGGPIFFASEVGNYEIVKYLIAKGADIAVKIEGSTPLEIAEKNGHTDVARLLQEKKKQMEEEERLRTAFIENADPLDKEIADADSIVASLFDELNEIKTRERAAEKQCADDIKAAENVHVHCIRSAEYVLADAISESNAKLATHHTNLEKSIAERVAAISFDATLRNKILALQEEKEEKDTWIGRWEKEIENNTDIISEEKKKLLNQESTGALNIGFFGGVIMGSICMVIDTLSSVQRTWNEFGCASVIIVPIGFVIGTVIYGVGFFLLIAPISWLIIQKIVASRKSQIAELEQAKQDASETHQRLLERKHEIEQSIEDCIRQGEEQLRKMTEPSIADARQKTETYQRSMEEEKQQKLQSYEEDKQRKIRVCEKQRRRKLAELEQERRQVLERFVESWRSAAGRLDALVTGIQCSQPQLTALTPEVLNTSGTLPETLVSGLANVSFPFNTHKIFTHDWQKSVPNLIDFPLSKLVFDKYLEEYKDTADASPLHRLLLRMLYALPVGMLEIISIDPKQIGNSLAPFKPLTECKEIVPHGRFIARQDEIEATLKELSVYLEDLIQKHFHAVSDWKSYNERHPDKKLPYKLLFIFGFPEQFTGKSISYLKSIIEHGLQHGILPVVTVDDAEINSLPQHEGKQVKEIVALLERNGQKIDELNSVERFRLKKLSITQENEPFPQHNDLIQYLEHVKNAYKQHGEGKKFSATIKDMWKDGKFTESSAEKISVLLGWTAEGTEVKVELGDVGDAPLHALLAGGTGSGKSNLIHVLIHGLLDRYSSEEINLYLLDYKEGIEFNVYANNAVPQIKLVSIDSDAEYGITVLEHISDELKRRADIFKKSNAAGIRAHREATKEKLPRILLIIDEFQVLFQGNREISEKATRLFTHILKQGRSAGVHVLLATQSLAGIGEFIRPFISQLGCRIALSCSADDSRNILSLDNSEAEHLIKRKEAIINDQNGVKSANRKFDVPHAKDALCADHLLKITEQTKEYAADTKIFRGSSLPEVPALQWFKRTKKKPSQIVLGEEFNFESAPLCFDWKAKRRKNLVIAGSTESVRNGLLHSLLLSADGHFDRIIYFNTLNPHFTLDVSIANFEVKPHGWDGNIADMIADFREQKILFIVDALEEAEVFLPEPTYPKAPDDTPPKLFRQFLENAPQCGSFVVAFAENWPQFRKQCRDYLGLFELRIGFGLSVTDAGYLLDDNGSQFKGLDNPNKAVFVDGHQKVLFRPFVVPTDGNN